MWGDGEHREGGIPVSSLGNLQYASEYDGKGGQSLRHNSKSVSEVA